VSEKRIVLVLGTRPEVIKLSPLVRECQRRDASCTIVHTGQHYSEELDAVFFDELKLPAPDYNLEVGSGSHGRQTGEMLAEIEAALLELDPDVVLVQGDTNSVLAGAIATSKLDTELGHIEAGLRSFDREMPEEINRVLTDHAADYLFAPTSETATLLEDEGIPDDRVYVTGNTIVDAVQQNREIAVDKSTVLADNGLNPDEFILLTAHRAENVDDRNQLTRLLSAVNGVTDELELPVIYPIHPRTRKRLDEFELSVPDSVTLVDPLDFLDFLRLEDEAALILTDSGGVQEEACILGTPCVTLRDSTERPETVDAGANVVAGTYPDAVLEAAQRMNESKGDWPNPFGDGTAATQILDVILDE